MESKTSRFVFQAEDGIRDLVRSRGLGDVYKRQVWYRRPRRVYRARSSLDDETVAFIRDEWEATLEAVSYTHLTLPTSDLV